MTLTFPSPKFSACFSGAVPLEDRSCLEEVAREQTRKLEKAKTPTRDESKTLKNMCTQPLELTLYGPPRGVGKGGVGKGRKNKSIEDGKDKNKNGGKRKKSRTEDEDESDEEAVESEDDKPEQESEEEDEAASGDDEDEGSDEPETKKAVGKGKDAENVSVQKKALGLLGQVINLDKSTIARVLA